MTFIPSSGGRVSFPLQQAMNLDNLRVSQNTLSQLSVQMQTGLQLFRPGQDPSGAYRSLTLVSAISANTQYLKNISATNTVLAQTDNAFVSFGDSVSQALEIGLRNSQNTLSDEERSADLAVINSMINDLLSEGNSSYLDRYLFSGQKSGQPFVQDIDGILYTGDNQQLTTLQSSTSLVPFSMKASDSIGTESASGHGDDLSPDIDLNTRLAQFNGGTGVEKGSVAISFNGNSVVVDLSTADDAGDVRSLINSAINASAMSGELAVNLNASGDGFEFVSGIATSASLQIANIGGVNTAADLGIATSTTGYTLNTAGDVFSGRSVDAAVTPTTPLSLLVSGSGLDTTGIQITNGSRSATLSFAGMTTVEELLNAVNASGTGVRAEINSEKNGINIVNVLSGSSYVVSEIQTAAGPPPTYGTTAGQLGVLTTDGSTKLSDFNGGGGVEFGDDRVTTGAFDQNNPTNATSQAIWDSSDIAITLSDSASFPNPIPVDLSGATTFADVQQRIQEAVNNTIPVGAGPAQPWITVSPSPTGQGFLLEDNTGGAGTFSVYEINSSPAGGQLGLTGTAAAGDPTHIYGADRHQGRVVGVLDSLLRLREALMEGDPFAVERATNLLTGDQDQLTEARGVLGARLSVLQLTSDRLTDDNLTLTDTNANIVEADFVEVVSKFQTQQVALQAALQSAGMIMQTSLFDFL